MNRFIQSLALAWLTATAATGQTNIEVYFSPKGGCTEAITKALDRASNSVLVQAYSFTSAPIAKALCALLPESSFGPLHLAHALRQLDQTAQAKAALLPVADKFPEHWRVPYLLACYCNLLGERREALRWLEKAIDVAGKNDIRMKAFEEPDLETLWPGIAEI